MGRKRWMFAVGAAVVVLGIFWIVRAGSVEPSGPPASTMKTLVEIEPRTAINPQNTPGDSGSLFRITQSGSYYLTGNVIGELGKDGIQVTDTADNVTIDLMGFRLSAPPGSSGTGIHMINTNPLEPQHDITIKSGTISGWGQNVLVDSTGAVHINDLRVVGSAGTQYGINIIGHAIINSVSVERKSSPFPVL